MNKVSVIILFILFIGILNAEVMLQHDVPVNIKKGREINLNVEVQLGMEEIEDVTVFYRSVGDITYITKLMVNSDESDPVFRSQIPGSLDKGNGVEYYFEARLKNNTIKTLPESQPTINPFRVHESHKSVTPSSSFVRLSPEFNTIDSDEDLVVAVSLFAIESQLKDGSLKILYDGKDKTGSSIITPNMIVFTDERPSAGTHSFQVTAELKNGKKILSRKWIVSVKSKYDFKMPYNISGNLRFTSNVYSRSADNSLNDKDTKRAVLSTHIESYYKKTSFFADIAVSSKESSKKQTVNRYTLGFAIPKLEVRLGDHSPAYSNFIMNSTNVRGFHTKFFTKKFRLLFNYGQSKRSIDSDVSVYGDSTKIVRSGEFQRNTLGARIEMGDYDGFYWGFSFVKNKDDVESLDEDNYIQRKIENGATIEERVVTPKDNLVVGADVHMNLFERRFKVGTELAISLYNNDIIDGVMEKDTLKDKYDVDPPIDPEDWENIIIINPNMQPLKPGDANIALRSYANLFILRNQFMLSYSEIGSSFKSLSSGSLQQDFRTISFSDNVSLFSNQLFFSGGLNITSDNLEKQRTHTNTSTSVFSNMNIRVQNLPSLSVSYNTTGTSSEEEEEIAGSDVDDYNPEIDIDYNNISTRLAYEVKQINVAPTTFSVAFNISNSVDNARKTFDNESNSFTFGANSRFKDLPMNTTFKYTFYTSEENYAFTDSTGSKSSKDYNSIYFKSSLRFMENTVKPYASIKYVKHGGDDNSQSLMYFNTGVVYQPFRPLTMSTKIGFNTYAHDDIADSDYSSFNWRFNLTYNF